MKCSGCKHWKRLPISDKFLPEHEIGSCAGLLSDKVDIELHTGHNGGWIELIETKHDFFCANYET